MADAAVEFLLQNLQQVLTRHFNLIKDAETHVKKLENDLSLFKAFLKDSTKKRRKDAKLQELLRMVRDVVYEAEDIIDAFVLQKSDKGKSIRSYFHKAFAKPVELLGIAEVVETVSGKINDIYERIDHFASLDVGEEDAAEEIEAPSIRKAANIVGFEDEAETMIKYLKEETDYLDVISIIGMPGLGKTTLAGMVFHHPEMQYEFPIRKWVYVSASFTKKDVFLTILKEFKDNLPEYHNKTDQELATLVSTELERGKFLIVMDDVWTPEDWKKLKDAFPEKGKVLLTSRNIEVGRCANLKREPHKLRFLTHEESCKLLSLEALGMAKFPPELDLLGQRIAKQCDRLPLALVVIGGILAGKYSPSAGMSAVEAAWEKVSKSVATYLSEDPERRMEKIISLSYDKLPYHLQACFLYLGMFPEDCEIPVWKLICLWIAEGFIQQKNNLTLEETAENYLEELINRNLVRSEKVAADGKVKTCRIHDTLREFCKAEAESDQENFLHEMKRSSNGGFQPPLSSIPKFRRLCTHTYILDFLALKPTGPRVRSFVCFPKDEIQLKNENISEIFNCFKLLRVLDIKPIKFTKLSSDLFKLFHLKYVHLSFKLGSLPKAFSKLLNIQTLIVDTTSSTLNVEADIWVMIHLRHFKTKASATLPKPGKGSEGGEKFQTLSTISPQSCTKEALDRARNLKKLGIRGKIAPFLEGKTGSFDSLVKLAELEKLKLLNGADSDGQVYGLPPHYSFPPKLKCLTLSGTSLEWRHMSILGLLENLKVLKLKDRAFMGDSWEAVDGGFRHLEVLCIGRTDLNFWKASAHHFPRLRQLKLHNCGELQEIPFGLADIPTFKLLDLNLSKLAVPSAKKIRDAKQKNREANPNIDALKLTLFPADE